MNTTFNNSSKIDDQQGIASITMNPEDAKARGFKQSDQVLVSNSAGEIELNLIISEQVSTGVVLSYKGRWLKREKDSANINVLNPGMKADMGGSSAVHNIEVTVNKLS